jgi:hypothetical protein
MSAGPRQAPYETFGANVTKLSRRGHGMGCTVSTTRTRAAAISAGQSPRCRRNSPLEHFVTKCAESRNGHVCRTATLRFLEPDAFARVGAGARDAIHLREGGVARDRRWRVFRLTRDAGLARGLRAGTPRPQSGHSWLVRPLQPPGLPQQRARTRPSGLLAAMKAEVSSSPPFWSLLTQAKVTVDSD